MIKIDYNVISDNLKKVDKNNYLVLKSNAYGFGFKKIFFLARNLGFKKYAVISIDDALLIKKECPDSRVLLMGVVDVNKLSLCQKLGIEITVNDVNECEIFKDYDFNVQIAINCGMNRFGIRWNQLSEVKEFYSLTQKYLVDKHFAASKWMPTKFGRIGAFIYEGSITVFAKIIKVNHVLKNEYVGYGKNYQMVNDGSVGVVDLGYADGLERKCNFFHVYIDGAFYPLIGYACMNHSFVLLPNDDFLGKSVEFISHNNPIGNYEKHFDTIKHQIYTAFLKKD